MRNKVIIIVALFVLGIGMLVLSFFRPHKAATPQTSVTINFSLPDVNSLSVTLNDKPLTVSKTKDTYHIEPGSYTLKATKPGYKDFSTSFSLNKGDTVLVNARMDIASDPTINSVKQINIPGVAIPGLIIKDVQYFYDKTWAVVNIETPDRNTGMIIAQYDPASKAWKTVLGPGTQFGMSDIQNLPSQVQDYLTGSGYVDSGGGQ